MNNSSEKQENTTSEKQKDDTSILSIHARFGELLKSPTKTVRWVI